jgi:phosphoribosylanthranilate isomerase
VALPFVKICCISSPEEASIAIAAGASAVGLVSAMPSGPGIIDDTAVRRIASGVKLPTTTFLLTALLNAREIIAQHNYCRTTTIQLVDRVAPEEMRELRSALPDVELVQVIHVTGEESLREAIEISALVDLILLDSGNQRLAVKELGGTGRTHDWNLSRQIVTACKIPVILAGGLGPSNIVEAINTVKPYGIDLCSSVRTENRLDKSKLLALFEAVHSATANRES